MSDIGDMVDPQQHIQFMKTKGSTVSVGHRDKTERIREAIVDLQLAIDGCLKQQSSRQFEAIASLARHSSIFLRKLVLGDQRNRRLLDADFCGMAGVDFDKLRTISHARRTMVLVPVGVLGGHLQIQKLNDVTGEPEGTTIFPKGPQRLKFDIEWPLPGMADWLSQPTPDSPWKIGPDALFESQSTRRHDCDGWLGQQLVMFDNRGITLKDVIRVMVNTEGAHSPPTQRLMLIEGHDDRARFRVDKDKEIHILSHITICGVRYSHAIVIEAAFYLYRKLARSEAIKQTEGAGEILQFCFAPDNAFESSQRWLRFDGGLTMNFGGGEQSVTHRVKAPS